MPEADRPHPLHPVLVSGGGRSGTTLLMQLLGTSPHVVFAPIPPFEHRYLTYLLRWAQLLRAGPPPRGWTQSALVGRETEMIGPLFWSPADLLDDPQRLWPECFLAAWEVFSAKATAAAEAARPGVKVSHYAEKTPPWVSEHLVGLLPATTLIPIRDPRDAFLSIVAFVARRGRPGFGMQAGEPPLDFARRFAPHQRQRLADAHRKEQEGTATLVRYEDLVADLPGQAARLGARLGLALDPAGVPGPVRTPRPHMTSASVELSVGRWRREMDPDVRQIFTAELAGELEQLGYQL